MDHERHLQGVQEYSGQDAQDAGRKCVDIFFSYIPQMQWLERLR